MITDNTFTADELKAAIAANKELVKSILPVLKEQNMIVHTTEEQAAAIKTAADAAAVEAINKKTSEIYSAIDADIKTAFGVEKTGPEEKTYDYLKRAAALKNTEIQDLNTKIKDGSKDEVLKQQLTAAQAETAKYKGDIEKLTNDIRVAKIRSSIDQGLTGVAFRADLPEILVRPAIDNVINELVGNAKEIDGKVHFHGADGKVILTGSNVATAKDILTERLKDLIDVERTAAGGGSKAPAKVQGKATGIKNKDGVDIVVPETIKTRVELHEYLGKQGLSSLSEDFAKIDETYPDLPLQ